MKEKTKFNSLGKYFIELIIVFFGVYGAFLLNEYNLESQNQIKREQISEGLIKEITDVVNRTDRVSKILPQIINYYDSLIAVGGMPSLEPRIEPVKVESHMWKASLESGVIDLFEVPLIFKISEFYNELNSGLEQINQLRILSETILIPNLNKPKSEFYNIKTGKLKEKYFWYFAGLKNLTTIAERISAKGYELKGILESSMIH